MPLPISSLRRWFAVAFAAVILVVAGTYFHGRHRVLNALKQVPEKMGVDIQQTAQGFSVSKSDHGRTLFKLQASKAIQFKRGGHTELHDVEITLYGRDSGRFDQIRGKDFDYDPQSGDVVAKGDVQIDLGANPAGAQDPDQQAPQKLKDSIHLKTSGLVFNQKTGDAFTKNKVEFQIPQATGSADGVSYSAKSSRLTLESGVHVVLSGEMAETITAAHGTISKNPDMVVLDRARVEDASRRSQADVATLFLRADNTIARVLAEGNVGIESLEADSSKVRAERMELLMAEASDQLRTAIFSGAVQVDNGGVQPVHASAGRMVVSLTRNNVAQLVHAEENVDIVQHGNASASNQKPQDTELTAPAVDVVIADGRRMERAETFAAGQIAIRPANGATGDLTLIAADKFEARFDDAGKPVSLHGSPNAKIVNQNSGQPDRVSTSDMVDVVFHQGGGIESLTQQGGVAYQDGERKASSDKAYYALASQMLTLTGSPRIADGGMITTARGMRFDRQTGDAFAVGDVKSTYNDLKAQPGGALLASSSPIHVTAQSMMAHQSAATALYTGQARLWQDANVVEAPSIEFNRDQRSVVARGTRGRPVSTVLFQQGANDKNVPVEITSGALTYTDGERKAEFQGGVMATGADVTVTSRQMDAFLEARGTSAVSPSHTSAGKLERIVAEGQVFVTQPNRRATGDHLVYTTADDKFVLTGGPPSIFDAERGKVTGVSLTLYRRDDRVQVNGDITSPAVTQTRVAR